MKLEPKSHEEIVADILNKITDLEESMSDLVEIVANRDEEIVELKLALAHFEEDLNKKIAERDEMLKSQAAGMKILAEGMKSGISQTGVATRNKDLEYLAMLLMDGGYLNPPTKEKRGIISKLFNSKKEEI